MAENFNLIPAKDLPEAVGEEVDVLCVEDGELKKKSGASIGGGAGGYVIRGFTEDVSSENVIITSISYDDFADIWYNGGNIVVEFVEEDGSISHMSPTFTVYTSGGFMLTFVNGDTSSNMGFTNGTWTPPTE